MIELTERQKQAIGKIVVDAFGDNFQTGRYAGRDDWVYVAWQRGPHYATRMAYISPDGTIHYSHAHD